MSGAKDRLTDSLYGLGWAGVRKLPEPAAAALGRRVADTAWRRRGAGVGRLEANLARVVPDASAEELPAWTEQQISERVEVSDLHNLRGAMDSGRGTVVALPHLANWDLAAVWVTTHLRTPFTTVAERLRPESLYDRFVAYRESLGMEVLPHTGASAFATMARRLRAGGLVCLVADRDLSASGTEVSFFGEPARMPVAPARLAVQTGAQLVPVTLWYGEAPRLLGRTHPPVEDPGEGARAERAQVMTQALADVFAGGIAQHPADWHMLQRLWSADLAPRDTGTSPEPGGGPEPGDGAPASAGPTSAGPGSAGTPSARSTPGTRTGDGGARPKPDGPEAETPSREKPDTHRGGGPEAGHGPERTGHARHGDADPADRAGRADGAPGGTDNAHHKADTGSTGHKGEGPA